ncbi:sulfatase [Shimia biformata]|uniref:sulfatase family protein n=1 Tax=Shimia biformata TaxID=1294299 RepID=UPI00194E69F8|nr:sulfatase-like hydrolase/transferase [Shimia biformata]
MTRPNVILISTDQQRGDCIGPEGRGVRTPNIDRIGARGVRFSNCITPHPMCQAARASILTGKLPYSHGVRDNGRDLAESFGAQGLGGIFDAAGYDTHFIGKAHFSSQQTFQPTGRVECYKSAKDFPQGWRGDYFGFRDVQMMLRPHHHTKWYNPPEALNYEYWLDQDGQGGVRWEKAKERLDPQTAHFQAWRSALEEEWHSSPWIGDRAVEMIEARRDAPFFAWVSFPDPHPPFLAPRPWCDAYGPQDVEIARHPVLDLENRPWWHRKFIESRDRTKQGAEHNAGGVDWGQRGELSEKALRDITAIYFGMIEAVDHQVGRLLDALEAQGKLDNTIVIFISDHGEWLGDHGLLLKGPMLYDGLLRVPCLIAGPGIAGGKVVKDPVNTIDIRSTVADLCGIAAEPDNGASWRPLFDGSGSRDFALSEYEVDAIRSAVDLDLRTVKTARYRMSVDLNTETGELYDLQEDPDEMVNLFDDAGQGAVRRELMEMIHARADDMIPAAERVGWH